MKYTRRLLSVLLAVLMIALCGSCGMQSAPQGALIPTPTPVPMVTPEEIHEVDVLMLVNPWNPIPEDYGVTLRQLENGQTVSALCYEELLQMLSDCAEAGHSAVVCSGYRNIVLQTQLYEDKVSRVIEEGHSPGRAEKIAAMEVAYPGTSEHHTGLAVDIVDAANPNLDETQAEMPAQQWLMENCHRYGFVLRYPEGKSDRTGIIYEPWHYRYVGEEAAEVMHEEGLCLEEYLEEYE
ncbi:MAG: M15 family metallopeptidase [Oscillospiraceae bacterium]|nr:M15 family metallopeptidase [Oscillospiraceae bacterium]